jgi:FkbM family methyltransferase
MFTLNQDLRLRILKEAGADFGSNGHLRVQAVRLGLCDGVPLVFFKHEQSVSAALENVGEWESWQTELLQLMLAPGDVVLDLGAHIGSHAIAFAGSVAPGGAVHAFEAQSGLADVLEVNAALSGRNVVHVHRCAVGDDAGIGPADDGTPGKVPSTVQVPLQDYYHNATTASQRTDDLTLKPNFGAVSLVPGAGLGHGSAIDGAASECGACAAGPPTGSADQAPSPPADFESECVPCTPPPAPLAAPAPVDLGYEEVPAVTVDSFAWGARSDADPAYGCPRLIKWV